MIAKVSIYYFIYTFKSNAKGEAPIYCKVSVNGKHKRFSTGISILPKLRDATKQKVRGKNLIAEDINSTLYLQTEHIQTIAKKLQENNPNGFSIDDLYFNLKQGIPDEQTFLKLMKERLDKMKELIGKEYAKDTYRKFKDVYNHTTNFIKYKYNMNDIPLKRLDYQFISAFQQYLLTERHQVPNSVNKTLQKVIETAKYAVKCGLLEKNPFMAYERLRVGSKSITFLTDDEIERLENYHFSQQRLEHVKDLYLFSVYSGLAYTEASLLCRKHIVKGLDGELWINMVRQKTNNSMQIPLLPPALKIIEKYSNKNQPIDKTILPMISNQRINSYLKEIAEILGINKRLTHHTARKTYASTILLNNDVPIEIVSKLLGHSSIRVTEAAYTQVMNKNISKHMKRLKQQLNDENE